MFDRAGTYRFTMRTDDGMRVWVDDERVFNEWQQQPPTTYIVNVTLAAGVHHIKVEWNDLEGEAVAVVSWTLGTPSSWLPSWLPPWLARPEVLAGIGVAVLLLLGLVLRAASRRRL